MGSAPAETRLIFAGQPASPRAVPVASPGLPGLPVLSALRELLPRGGLARGSVLAVAEFGLLCLALAAAASADGGWCGIAGIPEAGVLAAAGLGLDTGRTLLVPEPGPAWPQVVASLLDGCELVLVRPPARASAQVRQRLEATLRRGRGVLLVAGGAGAAAGRHPAVDRSWRRARAAAGLLRGGGGGRPRGGGHDADALALAARRGRPRRRGRPGGRPVRPPGRGPARAGARAAGGGRVSPRGFGADQPTRIMVVSCPELRGAEQGRETARRHERVIAVVTGFCPNVEVVEPGMCAFGARGPARYFGGEAALAARIVAAVAGLGIQVRIGVADGLF